MELTKKQPAASPPVDTPGIEISPAPGFIGYARILSDRLLHLEQHTVVLSLGFLCLFAANFLAPIDPDMWWHLATGKLIAESGSLPRHDVFSYTALGRPWHIPEWLSEIIMYRLYAAGGFATLVAGFSLVVTAAYFILYRLLLKLGIERTLALALVAWTAMIRWAQWAPRPQLVTFLFFSVCLYLLFSYKEHGRARLWMLPPMMALWVNLHGGFAAGFLLMGLFVVGEALNRFTGRQSVPLLPLIFAGIGSAAAALVNPYGFATLLEPLKYATTGNASTRYIAEWQSPNFHEPVFIPLALALVLFMIVGSRGRLDFTHSLILLAFTVMTLQSSRHMVLFALATAPILGLRLRHRDVRLVVEVGASRRAAPLVNLALLLMVPLFIAFVLLNSPHSQMRANPSTTDYPSGGAAYLREHPPVGQLFNTYGWGGYLIYELYPDIPVYIDGRSDFYGDEMLEEYSQVGNIKTGWRDVLEMRQVSTVLIEKSSPVAVLLASQDDWERVYEGKIEEVFVRKSSRKS